MGDFLKASDLGLAGEEDRGGARSREVEDEEEKGGRRDRFQMDPPTQSHTPLLCIRTLGQGLACWGLLLRP